MPHKEREDQESRIKRRAARLRHLDAIAFLGVEDIAFLDSLSPSGIRDEIAAGHLEAFKTPGRRGRLLIPTAEYRRWAVERRAKVSAAV